jgi:gliding motility associated protien GldN
MRTLVAFISCAFLTMTLAVAQQKDAKGQKIESKVRDGAYDKVSVKENEIIPYDNIREADVFWSKRVWRVIDVREKINLNFKYPKAYFVDILRNAAIEGQITVYDAIDDEFTSPMTPEQVSVAGVGQTDTITVLDPVTLEEKTEITSPTFDPGKVNKFRIKEDWIFDEETSTLVCRVIGIAPILEVMDENGEYRGDKVMFWTYYPELRPLLARNEVFNSGNDGVRLSWDDLFEMRYFGSYIIKESNVYDRRIQDYATGVDALYEADRVKNQIIDFEQDLWSY